MITSAQNSLIKQIRQLKRDKRVREKEGLFIVEGIQGVVEAVQSGAPVRAIVYAPDRLTSDIALQAVSEASARGVRCETVSTSLFESLSDRENPVGILAVVERRFLSLSDLAPTAESLYVALTEISDPGNLGTVLRTVDAVGGDALLLVGQTVDPFHPATVKASASTIFSVPIVQVQEMRDLLAWVEESGVSVIATSDRADRSYWETRYPAPLLLLMGSEAHGLPSDVLATLPNTVRIPMQGIADSLNLAIATALILYEVRRQQRA